MKTLASLAILSLVDIALGAPNYKPWPKCQRFDDNYDTLASSTVTPQLTPVGTYHGLTYDVFAVTTVDAASGYVSHSPNHTASTSMLEDIISIGSVTLNPFGTITTAPGTKSFDLQSFYFSCTVDLHETEGTVAEGCTIAVTGFDIWGKQVPEATFAFLATKPLGLPMVFAALPASYTNLKNVTIGIPVADVAASQTVLHLDDLVHCNYT